MPRIQMQKKLKLPLMGFSIDILVSEVKSVQLYQQRAMRTTAGVPEDFSEAYLSSVIVSTTSH